MNMRDVRDRFFLLLSLSPPSLSPLHQSINHHQTLPLLPLTYPAGSPNVEYVTAQQVVDGKDG